MIRSVGVLHILVDNEFLYDYQEALAIFVRFLRISSIDILVGNSELADNLVL